jgi:hypothetical protein
VIPGFMIQGGGCDQRRHFQMDGHGCPCGNEREPQYAVRRALRSIERCVRGRGLPSPSLPPSR